jgi:hypothetical protein
MFDLDRDFMDSMLVDVTCCNTLALPSGFEPRRYGVDTAIATAAGKR